MTHFQSKNVDENDDYSMFSGIIGIEKYFILLLLKIMSLFLIGKNEMFFLHFTVMKGER